MRSLTVLAVLLALSSVSVAKDDGQINDFVKQHLNSIGTEQTRAAVKSRAVKGQLQFSLVNGAGGNQEGKEVFISEGDKSVTLLKLPNPGYHGERFVCDGKKVEIAFVRPGVYSSFGSFVRTHSEILTEGLLGGALSTGWALTRVEENNAKLQDRGVKKINGRELHRVQYLPAKNSDLEIMLYFDPQTARHLMTTYSLTINPQMGSTVVANAKQDLTRYYLEERFDDFNGTDGVQLPGRWTLQFTTEIPAGGDREITTWNNTPGAQDAPARAPGILVAKEGVMQNSNADPNAVGARSPVSKFEVKEISIHQNVTLDPKNFEVK